MHSESGICDNCSNFGKLKPYSVFKMNSEFYKPEICGIVSHHFIKGLAYDAACKLKHPILLLQKVPDICQCNEDGVGRYSRLKVADEGFEYYSELCKKLRLGDKLSSECVKRDDWAAEYFLGDTEKAKENLAITDKDKDFNYITYICPATKFTELAFKVNVNAGLSFVMIVGQFLVNDGTEESKANIEEHNALMKECGFTTPTIETSKEELTESIKEAYYQIVSLKERIDTTHQTRLKSILSKHVSEAIPKIAGVKEWEYEELKDIVHKLMKEYAELAGIEKLSCFMTEHLNELKGKHIKNEGDLVIREAFFDDKQTEDLKLFSIDNLTDSDKWIDEGVLKQYTHMFYIANKNQFNIAVLMKIDETTAKDEFIMQEYAEYFKIMLLVIRGVALGVFSKHKNDMIDRFAKDLRHEMGQYNAGYNACIESFERVINHTDVDCILVKEAKKFLKHSESYSYNTMLRTNASRYIAGMPEPSKDYFLPYGAILYKWNSIYLDTMASKGLKLRLNKLRRKDDGSYIWDDNRPEMYADESMIEQVAYNLTNNAQKYSLPGTTVSIDCHLDNAKEWYRLIITSYGVSLEEHEYEKIFEDGYQGSNSKIVLAGTEYKDSGGIGLARSREIAEKHNGSLVLLPKIISHLCVPFFKHYLNNFNDRFKRIAENYHNPDEIYQGVLEENERVKRHYHDDWLAMNADVRTHDKIYTIADNITKSVTRYRFILSIPYTEKKR